MNLIIFFLFVIYFVYSIDPNGGLIRFLNMVAPGGPTYIPPSSYIPYNPFPILDNSRFTYGYGGYCPTGVWCP